MGAGLGEGNMVAGCLRHTLSVRFRTKLHSGLECELVSVARSKLDVRSPGCMSFSKGSLSDS
jgi:hypothetical protein